MTDLNNGESGWKTLAALYHSVILGTIPDKKHDKTLVLQGYLRLERVMGIEPT